MSAALLCTLNIGALPVQALVQLLTEPRFKQVVVVLAGGMAQV